MRRTVPAGPPSTLWRASASRGVFGGERAVTGIDQEDRQKLGRLGGTSVFADRVMCPGVSVQV